MIQEVEKSTNITNAVVYDALMRVFLETSQNERWGEKTNPTLSEDDRSELDGFRNHPYIKQRLEYVASHGTGQQAFPDDENAYQLK